MDISIDYNGKKYDFPLWTNKLEKEILLTVNKKASCQENMEQMFPIINRYPELNNIHYLDKLYIYLKCREYSVGNVLENMIVCNSCKNVQSISYKISDNTIFKTSPTIIPSEYGNISFKGSEIYLNDELLKNIQNLDILVNIRNNILKKIEHQLIITYQSKCMCGCINNIIHTETEILNDIVASIDVGELYKYYTNMQFNYGLSYFDLDNMYSFERNIYKNLYSTIEKEKDSTK